MWHSKTLFIQYAYSYLTLLESGLHGAFQSKSRYRPKSLPRVKIRVSCVYVSSQELNSISNCGCERTCGTVEECGTCIPMVYFVINRNQRERGKVTDLQLPSIPQVVNPEYHNLTVPSYRYGTGNETIDTFGHVLGYIWCTMFFTIICR